MEKRLLLFFVIAFLILQATVWYMEKTAPKPAPGLGDAGAGVGAAEDALSTATATATATPPAPPLPTPTPPPEVDFRDAPQVRLQVGSQYEIVFSTRGAVPLAWDIVHPRFVNRAAPRTNPTSGETPREPLIDPLLAYDPQVPHPFSLVLKEYMGPYYNELNTMPYEAEPIAEGERRGYRFISPPTATGLQVVKTFDFQPEAFLGRLTIELRNTGPNNLRFESEAGGLGLVLGPGLGVPPEPGDAQRRFDRVDAVVSRGDALEYRRITQSGQNEPFPSGAIRWGSIQNLYFMAAIIAPPERPFHSARVLADPRLPAELTAKSELPFYPTLELYTEPVRLAPGETVRFDFDVFAGPKQRRVLEQAGHDLHRILFHDSTAFMRWLCLLLMTMLTWFHDMLRNWGLAIIMLTVVVKIVTFPLVHKAMKAQAKMSQQMAKLKPLLDKINEKYKDDPQRKQQETWKLYREHGVNPLGMLKGCVWILIQIPIFFALYKLLYQNIDLRGAAFLWVRDLTQPDRLFVLPFWIPLLGRDVNLLPLLTAGTQMLASKFTTTPPTDEQQAQMQKMMIYMMPIMILIFTYGFPSGLMLYWLVSNLWQVLQQLWVNKHFRPTVAPPAPQAARAKP